jgi:hypothetical protein
MSRLPSEKHSPLTWKQIVAATLIVVAACRPEAGSILDERVADGRLIRSLVPASGKAAIVIYDAKTCFSCGSDLPAWQRAVSERAARVVILASPPVVSEDWRAFRLQRVAIAGALSRAPFSADDLPAEFIIEDGRVTSIALGLADTRARRLWNHVVDTPIKSVDHSTTSNHSP